MAELIIQILGDRQKAVQTLKYGTFPVTIGRGFSNDLILDDEFVCKAHARIEETDTGWIIHNLDAVNGVTIDNRNMTVAHSEPLKSGDIVVVGKTRLKVASIDEEVPECKPIHQEKKHIFGRYEPVAAWGLTLGVILVIMVKNYLKIGNGHVLNHVFRTTLSVSMMLTLIIFWCVIWTFVGRVFKHKGLFHTHLLLVSSVMVLIHAGMAVNRAVYYYSCHLFVYDFFDFFIPVILMGILLMTTLYWVTQRSGRLISMVVGILIVLSSALFMVDQLKDRSDFNDSPGFNTQLIAPWAQVMDGPPLDHVIKENERLFEAFETR